MRCSQEVGSVAAISVEVVVAMISAEVVVASTWVEVVVVMISAEAVVAATLVEVVVAATLVGVAAAAAPVTAAVTEVARPIGILGAVVSLTRLRVAFLEHATTGRVRALATVAVPASKIKRMLYRLDVYQALILCRVVTPTTTVGSPSQCRNIRF